MEHSRHLLIAVLASLAIVAGGVRADQDFVRGDTNGDGIVDTVDVENIWTYLFGIGTYWFNVPCKDAFDVDDSGQIDIIDAICVWRSWGGIDAGSWAGIPAPYPSPGPDPTVDSLGCESWLSYPRRDEPEMLVGVDGGTVAGGAQGHLATAIWMTTDTPVNALQLTLDLEGCPNAVFKVANARREAIMTGTACLLAVDGRSVWFTAGQSGYYTDGRIPAGTRTPWANLVVCLPEGTPAGSYRLCIDEVRIGLSGDLNAHTCRTQEGVVEVVSPVAAASCPDPVVPPSPDCWPPLPFCCWSEDDVEFSVVGPTALSAQDSRFTASVLVKSPYPLGSFDIALDFNEYLFRVADVAPTFAPEGIVPRRFDVHVGPEYCTTVLNDREEGYCAFHVELDPLPPEVAWNGDAPYEVARITFDVWTAIADLYGDTVLRFRDVGEGGQFINRADDGATELTGLIVRNLAMVLPGAEPSQVLLPEDADVSFRLSDASGSPGATGVPVYVFIDSNTALHDFNMWLEFDASILEYESTTPLAHISGQEPDFASGVEWLSGMPEGPHGVRLGCSFSHLSPVSDFTRPLLYASAPDVPVACIRFRIRDDAKPGSVAEVSFSNEYESRCFVSVFGGSVVPDSEPTEVHVNQLYSGRVLVDLETTIFLRGDSNDDGLVNIADAVWTLAFLFRDAAPPPCFDAADANDDGTIDIADPIALITTLFTPATCIAPPYPLWGADTTPDPWPPCAR